MIRGVQDELGPHSVVLWAAVVEERVGEVCHAFAAQAVPTAEEHCVLQRSKEKEKWKLHPYDISLMGMGQSNVHACLSVYELTYRRLVNTQ